MTKTQRFDPKLITNLIAWYDKNRRSFAWRENPDPYWIWVAEVMSQQTQLASVAVYLDRFLKAFPTVKDLAGASEDAVLKQWTGLGYYSRARNLHKGAQKIVEMGGFPMSYEGWLQINGVGPYTAAAVSSQAFGVKKPVWDGNVLRVCSRFFKEKSPYQETFKIRMLALLSDGIRKVDASSFNQGFMELGATICTPKNPSCGKCPLSKNCRVNIDGVVSEFPPPKPRKEGTDVQAKVEILHHKKGGTDFFWLEKRENPKWFSGMWDFRSELGGVKNPKNEIQVDAKSKKIGVVKHSITHHKIELHAYLTTVRSVKKSANGKWIALDSILSGAEVPVATTTRKVMKLLLQKKQDFFSDF